MAQFDELMQRALTVRNNVAPSSNTALLVGGVLVSIVSALQQLLDDKQDALTFDDTPTDGSTNPVTSDGIFEALAGIDLSACEKIINKVTSISAQSTDVQYPSAKLLYDSLQNLATVYAAIVHTHTASQITDLTTVLSVYELLSNKVAAVDEQSTDDQYPTAKLLFDISQTVDAYLANLDARVTSLENDPPVTYIIRGTSSNVGGTETFRVRFIAKGAATPSPYQNITVDVDAFGVWQLKYVNKQLYALDSFAANNTNLLSVDFTAADDLNLLTTLLDAFNGCSALTTVDLSSRYLTTVTSIRRTFLNCQSLTTLQLGTALLANVDDAREFIRGCVAITSVDLHSATFENAVQLSYSFAECTALTSIDLRAATFNMADDMRAFCFGDAALINITFGSTNFASLRLLSGGATDANRGAFMGCSSLTALTCFSGQQLNNLQYARDAFNGCSSLTSIDLSSATFSSLINARDMFYGCSALTAIDLSSATFNVADNVRELFRNCLSLVTIKMDVATFAAVEDSRAIMLGCSALTTIVVPSTPTAIAQTATPSYTPMPISNSQYLTYQSMLNVANWLRDFTGASAHTITFNTTAWNALTAAEQSNIDAILTAKNWTRVLSN